MAFDLEEVYQECQTDYWDGYGGRAVGLTAFEEAQRFCELLPFSVPSPEVAADPDGEIAFEWRQGPDGAFSVSIGPNHRLTYAGIFGPNRVHGVEHFGDEFPQAILNELSRLRQGYRATVDAGGHTEAS